MCTREYTRTKQKWGGAEREPGGFTGWRFRRKSSSNDRILKLRHEYIATRFVILDHVKRVLYASTHLLSRTQNLSTADRCF